MFACWPHVGAYRDMFSNNGENGKYMNNEMGAVVRVTVHG